MIPGRFVIDTHVHAQRHAFKFQERGIDPNYATLAEGMSSDPEVVVYDNSARLVYDMERYGVDMCIISPAFGMTDEINLEIMKKYPDKFICCLGITDFRRRVWEGEIEGTIDELCQEVDKLLATGNFRGGLREGLPMVMNPRQATPRTQEERMQDTFKVMEVARAHKVPVSGPHGGSLSGYAGATRITRGPSGADAAAAAVAAMAGRMNVQTWGMIASNFPEVPIVMEHGGMQGWWSEMDIEPFLRVAAGHSNVYLETGLWWAELYERPLRDVNIGCNQLIWGTDWGASIPQQWWPGGYPDVYPDQNKHLGPPAHQVDYYGWQYRELMKLNIPQDDLNQILGGNSVRIMGLEDKVPHTRLFTKYLR